MKKTLETVLQQKGLNLCEAARLAELAIGQWSDRTGFDPKLSWRPRNASVNWEEFEATGPERCVNKNTALEEYFQRGRCRIRHAKLTVSRDWELSDGGPNDPYGPCSWVGPFDPDSWQVVRGIEPVWLFSTSEGEWGGGVMTDDGFVPAAEPVVCCNGSLPTVGERIVV